MQNVSIAPGKLQRLSVLLLMARGQSPAQLLNGGLHLNDRVVGKWAAVVHDFESIKPTRKTFEPAGIAVVREPTGGPVRVLLQLPQQDLKKSFVTNPETWQDGTKAMSKLVIIGGLVREERRFKGHLAHAFHGFNGSVVNPGNALRPLQDLQHWSDGIGSLKIGKKPNRVDFGGACVNVIYSRRWRLLQKRQQRLGHRLPMTEDAFARLFGESVARPSQYLMERLNGKWGRGHGGFPQFNPNAIAAALTSP